jgi:hypothetical protein
VISAAIATEPKAAVAKAANATVRNDRDLKPAFIFFLPWKTRAV